MSDNRVRMFKNEYGHVYKRVWLSDWNFVYNRIIFIPNGWGPLYYTEWNDIEPIIKGML